MRLKKPVVLVLVVLVVIGATVLWMRNGGSASDGDRPVRLNVEVDKPVRVSEDVLGIEIAEDVDHVAWRELIGKKFTVVGRAESMKVGSALRGEHYLVYIGLPDIYWPSEWFDDREEFPMVRVTGVVNERSDLPVFISDGKGLPMIQGIPMPPGTDLEEARKRIVIEATSCERLAAPR